MFGSKYYCNKDFSFIDDVWKYQAQDGVIDAEYQLTKLLTEAISNEIDAHILQSLMAMGD